MGAKGTITDTAPFNDTTRPVSVSEGTDFGQKKFKPMGLLVYGLNQ